MYTHTAMRRPVLAVLLATLPIFLASQALAQGAKPIAAEEVKYRKKLFQNGEFSVFLLDIPPHHASVMHRHSTDLLTIFFEGGKTRGTIYGQSPKEDNFTVGDVRFRPSGFTHLTENIGDADFRAIILEFSSPAGPVEPPSNSPNSHHCDRAGTVCVDESHLLCTAKFCIMDVSLGPGSSWGDDSYGRGMLLVAISPSQLSRKLRGKSAKSKRFRSGEVEYVPVGQTSQWKNVSGLPARFMAVLFRS